MIKHFVKKILSLGTLLLIGSVVFFAIPIAAFEAHVISVTARIENDPEVPTGSQLGKCLVINEVYYDVAGDKGIESKNEWIELYNGCSESVSIKNWSLENSAGISLTINPNVSLAPGGFAVLSHDNTTWVQYWTDIPEGAEKIQLTGIGEYLSDTGDKLILKKPDGTEADWVAWESFVADWSFVINESESVSRKLKGVDTDLPADWEVLAAPNPGI